MPGRAVLVLGTILTSLLRPGGGLAKCCPDTEVLDLHTKLCMEPGPEDRGGKVAVNGSVVTRTGVTTNQLLLDIADLPTAPTTCHTNTSFIIAHMQIVAFQMEDTVTTMLQDTMTGTLHQEFCVARARDWRGGPVLAAVGRVCGCEGGGGAPCVNFCQEGQEGEGGVWEDTMEGERVVGVRYSLHCEVETEYPRRLWGLQGGAGMMVDGEAREPSEYCVRRRTDQPDALLLCAKEEILLLPSDTWTQIKMGFETVSLVSLLMLFVVHVTSGSLRRQLFTQLKLPFFCTLFFLFLSLVVTQAVDFTRQPSVCLTWALVIQWCSFSTFSLLSAMSFDIWLTFRKLRNPLKEADQPRRRMQVRLLQVGSFLLPSALTLGTLAAQLASTPEEATYIHPNIGATSSCFLGQHLPQLLYFHVPAVILLSLNLGFYCLLIHQFVFGIYHNEGAAREALRNTKIFIKFLVIMGINWLSEGVAFLVEWQAPDYRVNPLIIFMLSCNQLSGLFLLLAFLSRRRNREELLGCRAEEGGASQGTLSTNLPSRSLSTETTSSTETNTSTLSTNSREASTG